jgi:hypothetical protein
MACFLEAIFANFSMHIEQQLSSILIGFCLAGQANQFYASLKID